MLVNHQHKIVSVSVPKTGSTSIHHALMGATGTVFKAKNSAASIYHLSAQDIKQIMGPVKFNSYYSFGVVRNPFDRVVSLFHDFGDQRGAIKSKSFEDFVLNELQPRWGANVHFLPQEFFLAEDGKIITTDVFRFEDGVENALKFIVEKLGIRDVEIGHARKSERGDWSAYYSNGKVAEIVATMYKPDFDMFGYDIDIA